MTTIKYTEKAFESKLVKISLDGHADFNPGNDPVCAGLSTVTFQLLNVLDMYEHKGIIGNFSSDIRPGHTVISFIVYDQLRWELAWEIIKIGYENIAEAYPNNVFFE